MPTMLMPTAKPRTMRANAFPLGLRVVLFALLFVTPPLQGEERHQSHASLEAAIIAFVDEQLGDQSDTVSVAVGYIDPRLRLAQCATPPEVFIPPGSELSGRTTVGLRCSTPEAWTIYIPVSVQFSAPVVVTSGYLQRGRPLTKEDVSLEDKDTTRLRGGYFRELDAVLGMVPRTGIGPGTVLRPNQIEPPRVIRRGDRVSITAESETFSIRMEGEAMEDGREGETIRVKNLSSGRELDAVVSGAGQVTVRKH